MLTEQFALLIKQLASLLDLLIVDKDFPHVGGRTELEKQLIEYSVCIRALSSALLDFYEVVPQRHNSRPVTKQYLLLVGRSHVTQAN